MQIKHKFRKIRSTEDDENEIWLQFKVNEDKKEVFNDKVERFIEICQLIVIEKGWEDDNSTNYQIIIDNQKDDYKNIFKLLVNIVGLYSIATLISDLKLEEK